jgi:hypothetical protein
MTRSKACFAIYGGKTALWIRRRRWFFLATVGLFMPMQRVGVGHCRMKAAAH